LQVKRNHRRAAPMTGSTLKRVLVPSDFGTKQLNGDAAIDRIQVA